jgi:hypothetical protein
MGKSSWSLVVVALLACSREEPPPARQAPAKKPSNPSAWKEIETPVPVGKKLACDRLLPDEKLAAVLGRKVEVVDDSTRDADATAVCRLVGVDRKGKRGEELCMVTIGCWSQWSVGEIRKRCDARGGESSTDLGTFTCVESIAAGEKQRHMITVLEPDTRCRVVVNAGPHVYDLASTRACALAVVELLDQDSLKQ